MTWLRHALRTQWRSLHGRVLLSLTGLLLLLLALQVGDHLALFHSRRSQLAHAHERAAARAGASFRAGLEGLYRGQGLVAQAALGGRVPPDQVAALLEDFRRHYPGVVTLALYGPDGTLRYATPRDYAGGPAPFLAGLTPQSPRYLSNVYAGPERQEPRVRAASLVVGEDGESLAVVAMELTVAAVEALLGARAAGEAEALVDGAGRLAYTTLPRSLNAELESSPAVRRVAHRAPGGGRPAPLDLRAGGTEVMGSVVPVPGTTWAAVYLRTEKQTLAQIMQDAQQSSLVLLAVLGLWGTALLFSVRLSLRPLVRLSVATRKLGSGDLSFRLPPAEVEEFEPLVESFNRMAARLEAAHVELLAANQVLEARVRERTEALEAEHQKLLRAERLSTLGLFSSAIAHDLRNPLNTATLGVHWLKARARSLDDPRMRERLEMVERELRRAEQIIRTLLGFARSGEPNREPLDVNDLLREVLEVVGPQPGVTLEAELAPALPPLAADRAQLFQVLENLVRNAVQAMPDGGTVTVRSEAAGERCALWVCDTGPGIPEELRESIFEPLVTTRSTGTGLGLALCKRIVEAHGGRITVDTPERGGACFRVELPLRPPQPAAAPAIAA